MKSRDGRRDIEGVKIVPLGGLENIGMNITAFEYEDSIVVVDCGLAFPEDDMLGIDLVIPDISYLKENIQKVKGFIITHGHEDHIGAVPYVLQNINVPIYGTRLTCALIENKLKEHKMKKIISKILSLTIILALVLCHKLKCLLCKCLVRSVLSKVVCHIATY